MRNYTSLKLCAVWRTSAGVSPVVHYYHTDRQYNVRGLTDASGNILEIYAYTPYGKQTILDNSGLIINNSQFANAYGFTGRHLDAETGLWYFRARYFSDELGRFISRDPLGYVDGMGLYNGYFAMYTDLDPYGKYTLDSALSKEFNSTYPYTNRTRAYSRAYSKWRSNRTNQQIYDTWLKWEKRLGNWWKNLPKCPCDISCKKVKKVCVAIKIHAGYTTGGYVERIYTNVVVDSICNPDKDKWEDPKRPTGAEASLHPGAVYSMRSKLVGGHSNQCTYDAKGKLITEPPGSGTVDYKEPGTWAHWKHDVETIILANSLDGGNRPGFIGMARGQTQMVTPPKRNVLEYYKVRPFWGEECPKNP